VQTNFHIIPLLNKAHHPNRKSLYWQIFQTIEWDIRSRALKLSRLGYVDNDRIGIIGSPPAN
jgi:hypothetical protein